METVPLSVLERIVFLSERYEGLVEHVKRERLGHKGSMREQLRERRLDLAAVKTEWDLADLV